MHASRGGLGTCWASLSLSLALAVLSAAVPSAARGDRIKIGESEWKDPPKIDEQVAKAYLESDKAKCGNCHASRLLPDDGKAILGLGNNFTDAFVSMKNIDTIFVNPAINLTAVFFSLLEPATLAERATPDPTLAPPDEPIAPVRVPPWWRVKDKNASFYIASARGNRATHMMIADLDEVGKEIRKGTKKGLFKDEADYIKHINERHDTFAQVAAYIRNHTSAPKFEGYRDRPGQFWVGEFKVNKELAEKGATVFKTRCASCHAVEGATLLVTTDDEYAGRKLGTDEALCKTPGNRKIDADWFNKSLLATVLGGEAKVPEKCAYVAPPLVGIWAAAPYFHNGSVPTLEGVLNSSSRPAKWAYAADGDPGKRVFDAAAVGWKVHPVTGQEKLASKFTVQKYSFSNFTYNTSRLGFSNKGHTYGDTLSDSERKALIEYLKTL
jgi:hypothetical protein